MSEFVLSKPSIVYAQYQRGEITANAMSAVLHPTVLRIAKSVAAQYAHRHIQDSALNMAQDVTQDVMCHLLTDVRRNFEAGMPVEPFVAQIVRRKILKQYLDVSTTVLSRYAPNAENLDHDSFHDSDPEYHHDFEADVDRQHARERIQSVMLEIKMRKEKTTQQSDATATTKLDAGHVLHALHADGPPVTVDMSFAVDTDAGQAEIKPPRRIRRSQFTGEPIKPQYTMTREQLRLAEIMNQLHYTQDEFAIKLGLLKPTLASYLYGRTDSVPEHVMSNAELCLTVDKSRLAVIQRFQSSDMGAIILDWLLLLGLQPELSRANLKYLAKVLEVNVVTLERWLSSIRPKPNKYLAYHAIVEAYAASSR